MAKYPILIIGLEPIDLDLSSYKFLQKGEVPYSNAGVRSLEQGAKWYPKPTNFDEDNLRKVIDEAGYSDFYVEVKAESGLTHTFLGEVITRITNGGIAGCDVYETTESLLNEARVRVSDFFYNVFGYKGELKLFTVNAFARG